MSEKKSSIERFGDHVYKSLGTMKDNLVRLVKAKRSKSSKSPGYKKQKNLNPSEYRKLVKNLKKTGKAKPIFGN
jgi:hypothetical protein